jgi:hypothetical protein
MDSNEEGGKVVALPVHPSLGVPFDSAAFDRTDSLYQAIERGEHDDELDGIERAANARKRARSHPRMELWEGPAPTGWTDGIAAGYYDCQGREGMQMILGAIRNRRITLHNAELVATRDRLQAEAPRLKKGDRVRVRLDMPANRAGEVLLGKTGTVEEVKRTTCVVRFDDGQALGRFAAKGRRVKMQMWTLERIDSPAPTSPPPAPPAHMGAAEHARALAEPPPGTLVRSDLFQLLPAQAALLADLLELEIQTTPDDVGPLVALQRRLQQHAEVR